MQLWGMAVRLNGCDLAGAGVQQASARVQQASRCWGAMSKPVLG